MPHGNAKVTLKATLRQGQKRTMLQAMLKAMLDAIVKTMLEAMLKAKYNSKAKTEHVMPVDLSKKDYNELMNQALKAHKLIGCTGVTRSDFKFFKGKFYLLEINTQPGMTSLSLVPEIAAYHGINFIKLIELILKNASTKK